VSSWPETVFGLFELVHETEKEKHMVIIKRTVTNLFISYTSHIKREIFSQFNKEIF
jgi:hypothetical protein